MEKRLSHYGTNLFRTLSIYENLRLSLQARHQGPAAPLLTDLAYRKRILWL
jgi:hypothetical protein